MKKIQIQTFGCKVNQYESAAFRSGFAELGHQVVSSGSNNDVIVINTCSVTGKAGAQSRQAIRRAVRENPEAKIIITGCYSQLAGEELQTLPELLDREVCIIGNGDKHLLVDAALENDFAPLSPPAPLEENVPISSLPIQNFGDRTRAYLRIQDGCNSFCSYCIVPYTRGRSRSLPIDEVIQQAEVFSKEGYKEIVVTGIHVGNYGIDLPEKIDITSIMAKLCRLTPDIRYRLSSIEPTEISPALLESIGENSNFMPHLHIPLQSGSDDILSRMNRKYSTSHFAKILQTCRDTIADLAIGLDVLAGFPGESEKDFEETYTFLEREDFTYLHVFPYSKRPGTPAAKYPDQVPTGLKDIRVKRLRGLSDAKKKVYYDKFIGSIRSVLVEKKHKDTGLLKGFTDNYIPVVFPGDTELQNSVVQVRLNTVEKNHILGSMV